MHYFFYFLNQLINGIGIGGVYALVALGYTMVYGIVKLINFAHGDLIMVSSYLIMVLLRTFTGLPFWAALIITMVLVAIIGVVIEMVAYRPLRNAPRINILITAIGVSLFLENLFMLIFKADPIPFKTDIQGNISFFGITIEKIALITIVTSVFVMILLTIFIKKTKIGKAMRAVSEDAGAATLMGIHVNHTISITFAIGSALAALGGGLYSSAYPLLNPYMGAMFGLKAFVAAVLGGIGIIPGAMLGGFILGIAESLTKGYISSNLSDTVVFSILILVLIIKPTGLLGKNTKEKV